MKTRLPNRASLGLIDIFVWERRDQNRRLAEAPISLKPEAVLARSSRLGYIS